MSCMSVLSMMVDSCAKHCLPVLNSEVIVSMAQVELLTSTAIVFRVLKLIAYINMGCVMMCDE